MLLTKKIEIENYSGFKLNEINNTKKKFTEIIKDYKEKPNFASYSYGKYGFVYFNHLLKIIEKIEIYNKKINEIENINGLDVILNRFCLVDIKKRIKKTISFKEFEKYNFKEKYKEISELIIAIFDEDVLIKKFIISLG